MGLRHGLLASFSLVALTASAGAQTSPAPPVPRTAAHTKLAQASAPVAPKSKSAPASKPAGTQNVPHTLIEALAATYSNQPALQAERAKLRATDENGHRRLRRRYDARHLRG
jgi:outer membrane protein